MRKTLIASLLLCSTCLPTMAQAQSKADDAAADDEAIVVTAQRREQSILSVPLAISAISGDALGSKGLTNSSNLQNAVPNLQISSPYGQTQPNFSLRGISVANEYNSNQASPVGVYVNDVYLANRTAHGMGLFDLDRVEVLRGPQGTLFGRNTTGGAINFITKGPSLSAANGYAELGYGNFNTFTGQAAAEATLIEDSVGLRIAGNWINGDGQVKNRFAGGRDAYSQDSLQGRATLRVRPAGGPLDVKLMAYAGRDRGSQAAVHGFAPFRTGLGFFETNENRMGQNRTEAWGVSANIKYELSDALTFTSITSRDGGKQDLQQAADGSPIDILDITWLSKYNQFSEEARFNYASDRVDLVGGLFHGWDKVITDNRFNIGSMIAPGVDGGFFQHYDQLRKSTALFGQADVKLTPQLTLTLGARYTWDRSEYRDGYAYLFMAGVGQPMVPLASTVPCATPPGTCAYNPALRYAIKGSNNALTGRVALSYKTDAGTLLYASYNRGYRAGAFNGGGYTSSVGITYIKPERVNAYEAGFKGRFGVLTLAGAAFYYDYNNQQVQDTRAGPVSFLVNAPKSEVYGGELEASARVAPMLSLNLAAGLLHARYKQLTLQGTVLNGSTLPFAPGLTLQAGADLTLLDNASGKLTLSPSVTWFSRQYFSPFNAVNAVGSPQVNSELQQPGYAKVNMSAAFQHGPFTLRAFVNNLFDEKTYVYGLDLRGAGFPYNYLVPSTPRTFGAAVKVAF